jgi:hypothetical protein
MADAAGQDTIPGLVGEWAGGARLTRLKGSDLTGSLDLKWEGRGRGVEWSAWWRRFVRAPVTGDVTFHVETPMQAILEVGDRTVAEVGENETAATGVVRMEEGTDTPICVTYMHAGGRESFLRVMW